jgi:ApbE superfamily uncharacterized protein (UPF0280 family)
MAEREYADRSLYRRRVGAEGLTAFTVSAGESDLHISAERDLSAQARRALEQVRARIESYIAEHGEFRDALRPLSEDPAAPVVVANMLRAAAVAGTGPMAAVAGAVAGAVGRRLMAASPEVIVENGGDVFAAGSASRVSAVFAGESKLSMELGVRLPPAPEGLALCTSSGTVGPSLSYGRADAAVVLSRDECLADAVATALGNRIASREDLGAAMEWAESVEGVSGALAIIGEDLAAWGQIELVRF